MDDALRAIERAAIAEEVASALRHDLRNKLGAIRNAAYFIKRQTCDTEAWRSDARLEMCSQVIEEELAAASAMLDQRMALGHLFGNHPVSNRLSDCVDRALQNRPIPPDVYLAKRFDGACSIVADPLEIALLARCLIDNAIEAMTAGGALVIGAFEMEGTVSLAIEDSGPGFCTDHIEGRWQAFQTRKPGHAGLGLCIVRRIASRYGATVRLESRSAGGAVTVVFPQAIAKSSPTQALSEETEP